MTINTQIEEWNKKRIRQIKWRIKSMVQCKIRINTLKKHKMEILKNSIYKVTTIHVLSYIPPLHLAIQLMYREPDYIDAATHGITCFKSYPSLLANSPSLLRALWNLRHASLISVYKSQIASTHSIGSRSVERAVPKVVTAHTFFTRPVNTLRVKHQHTVILTSGLRGDSLTSLSLTHQSLLSLTCCLTDFMHA